jgi:hypothetical protein
MRNANYKIIIFWKNIFKKLEEVNVWKVEKPQVNEKKNEKLPQMKMKKKKRNERAPLV